MATLYAIGSNGSGQLGIGHKEDVSVPKEVLFFKDKPSSTGQPVVRAGGNHTLLLFPDGALFSAGDHAAGARGLVDTSHQSGSCVTKFQFGLEQLETVAQQKVVHIAATWEASFIVTEDCNGLKTQVYSLGTGSKGELGLGEFIFRTSTPQLIKDFPPAGTEVIDLAASVSHIVAVLSNGEVFGWGSGRKGQLGKPEGIFHHPRKISDINFRVVRVVCGREFTHLMSASGQSTVLGSDKWDIRKFAPGEINDWEEVGTSWGSILVLKHSGEIISWGRNDHGQLAPANLPTVSHIAVGSEHTLALTNDGDVIAWGWGEHGNCGPHTIDGDVKGRWNVVASSRYLPQGSSITGIGAGCATSWICIGN